MLLQKIRKRRKPQSVNRRLVEPPIQNPGTKIALANVAKRDRLSRVGIQRVRGLLKIARADITARINQATGFEAYHLPQMKAEVTRVMHQFQQEYLDEFRDLGLKVEDLGTDLVRDTLTRSGIEVAFPSLPFDITNTLAEFHADQIKNVSADAIRQINMQISTGILGGTSKANALKNIAKLLPSAAGAGSIMGRAIRIVRTEVNRIHSITTQHRMDTAAKAGVNLGKYWRSVGDDRTREDHLNAERIYNSQSPIKHDDFFLVGTERAQYPRDPRLSGEQTINCRCVSIPIVMPRGTKWGGGTVAPPPPVRPKPPKPKKVTAKAVDPKAVKPVVPQTRMEKIQVEAGALRKNKQWKQGDHKRIQALGKEIRTEIDDRMYFPGVDAKKEEQKAVAKMKKFKEDKGKFINKYFTEDKAGRDKMDPQMEKMYKREAALEKQKKLTIKRRKKETQKVLGEIRDFTGVPHTKVTYGPQVADTASFKVQMGKELSKKEHSGGDLQRKSFSRAQQYVPKKWNQISQDGEGFHIGDIYYYRDDRAFYKHTGDFRGMHMRDATIKNVQHGDSTMLHEYGHRHENLQRRLRSTLQEFYDVRTAGEKSVDIHEIYDWYKPGEEFTKVDKFAHPYVGKVYPVDTEVLTTGLEGVFFNRHGIYNKDKGHYDLILGLLAGI